jgi:hypothetical protein
VSAVVADGWVRVRPSEPCPVCRGKKWCLVHHGRGLVACTDPDHPSPVWWDGLNAHVHSLDGRPVGPDWRDNIRPIRPEVPAPRPPLDPDALDRAYRALLAACPLSPAHRAAMVERGMSPEEIAAGGYGSLAADGRERTAVVAGVTTAIGADPVGRVPGFARKPDRSVGINAVAGMLIPVRDITGRIVALRVRVDDPEEAEGGKYRWLSGGAGGVGVDGHTLHVALPPGPARPWRRVVVVEGEIKAGIVAHRMRLPVLSVPGVANTGRVVDHLRLLDEGSGLEVAVAFDADKATNPHVARAEQRLVVELRAAGYRVVEWAWSEADGKGLDDLIVRGLVPAPGLYPDDLPLTAQPDPAPNQEVQRMLREAREQRDQLAAENRLLNLIVAKKDLGGDVGNTVALRVANYASWYASANNLQPGDPIPLVSKQIAKEFFDPETGRDYQAVSDTTVGKALRRFIDKGMIETVETTHTYRHDGVDKRVKVPGLVWSDRLALLERFADGSVMDDGEERNRGGKREKRVPLVCPDCGRTHVACTGCGQVFDAVAPAGELVYLVHQDDPPPDVGHRRPLDEGEATPTVAIFAQAERRHPRLLDDGGPRPRTVALENSPPGDVRRCQVRRGWPAEQGRLVDEGDSDGLESLDLVPF